VFCPDVGVRSVITIYTGWIKICQVVNPNNWDWLRPDTGKKCTFFNRGNNMQEKSGYFLFSNTYFRRTVNQHGSMEHMTLHHPTGTRPGGTNER
jgi:hypothetical protein